MSIINHLNPASSKTRRNYQSASKRQIKLSQSVDQTDSFSMSLQRKHKLSFNISAKKEQTSQLQALKDTVYRMAMQITQLKSQNLKLSSELKQTQNMQQYYLKELEQRKQKIIKLQDIMTLSKLPNTSIDLPIEIGIKSQQEFEPPLSSSMMNSYNEGFPSRLHILKKKFQNKQNNWDLQHKRIKSQAKRQK